MKFFEREPFDDQKVEAIRIQLENCAASGNPSDFQVILDDMEVVPRTNNVELFRSFYELISDKTKSLNIHVYSGSSRHRRTYSFHFGTASENTELGGVDQNIHSELRVQLKEKEMENGFLKKHIAAIEDLNQELQEENQELKKRNTDLEDDLTKTHSEGGLTKNIIGGVETVVKHLFPNGFGTNQNGLSGAPNTYYPPAGTTNIPIAVFEEFQRVDQLAKQFEQDEFPKVLEIIQFLAQNKPAIDETLSYLTEEN